MDKPTIKKAEKKTPKPKAPKKKKVDIICFDDWETWAPAASCTLVHLTPSQFRRLEKGDYPKHLDLSPEQLVNLKDMLGGD